MIKIAADTKTNPQQSGIGMALRTGCGAAGAMVTGAVGGTRSADDLGGIVNGVETGAVYEGEIWNPATEQWTAQLRTDDVDGATYHWGGASDIGVMTIEFQELDHQIER